MGDERRDRVHELFYLMTVKLEDAAGLAADGQGGGLDLAALLELAQEIHSRAEQVGVIADAVVALLQEP